MAITQHRASKVQPIGAIEVKIVVGITVEYGEDVRYGADWAKCHALVGVETMVVMAVIFSGTRGDNTHDSKFLLPLIERVIGTFPLQFLLGDKAYLTENHLKALWDLGIKAAIPLKKNVFKDASRTYHEAVTHLVQWFDLDNNRVFHEVYRLRPKIEGFFSLMKRLAQGYCWSRGRSRKEENADVICTAWKNELLCKFIYMNLRATVLLEKRPGSSSTTPFLPVGSCHRTNLCLWGQPSLRYSEIPRPHDTIRKNDNQEHR